MDGARGKSVVITYLTLDSSGNGDGWQDFLPLQQRSDIRTLGQRLEVPSSLPRYLIFTPAITRPHIAVFARVFLLRSLPSLSHILPLRLRQPNTVVPC